MIRLRDKDMNYGFSTARQMAAKRYRYAEISANMKKSYLYFLREVA